MGPMAAQVTERARGRWPAPGTIRDHWTASDLDDLPDDGLRYELIDGTLIVSPAPRPYHQRAIAELVAVLRTSRSRGLEVLFAPLDWRPDGITSVQPDVLVVRSAEVTRERLVGTPLLLVEVASPASRALDRTVKFERYARAGVPQYWIVDPGTEDRPPSIEVFDLVDGDYRPQVRADGDQTAAVTGPVPVAVTPSALVAPPAGG